MKHQAITLVKFKALARRLRKPTYEVVGILETLWIFAQIHAKSGDLSAYSADDIAAWMDYDGDADALMAALVATRWLDETAAGGWVIHDWDDHKPNYLKGVSARSDARRAGLPSAEPSSELGSAPSSQPSSELGAGPSTEPGTPHLTQPNLTQEPNQTQQNQTKPITSPPTPPHRRGGGVRARGGARQPDAATAAGEDPATVPSEYPPGFLELWRNCERGANGSTLGSRSRAWDAWCAVPAERRGEIPAAWETYAAARRAAAEKTEHLANWLRGDWAQYLEPNAGDVRHKLDPKALQEAADEERKTRAAAYRRWETACALADGAGRPRPPKPTLLTQPPKLYDLPHGRGAKRGA